MRLLNTEEKIILKRFLWDTDIHTFDMNRYKVFLIARILKLGRKEDIQWMRQIFSDEDIIDAVKKSKSIDRKTANFWMIHYNIPKEDITCLNMPLISNCFY